MAVSSLGGLASANWQVDRHAAVGRLQLRTKAGQNSAARSFDQPGSSAQSAATQRAGVGLAVLAGGEAATGGGLTGAGIGGDLSWAGAGDWTGLLAHAASIPRIKANKAGRNDGRKRAAGASRPNKGSFVMWLILLEALAALLALIFIVWWTMFSGRKNGERKRANDDKENP
ncbi:MAG: hypothetical protein ACOVOX_17170 [Burkholderiaceae bacterium]